MNTCGWSFSYRYFGVNGHVMEPKANQKRRESCTSLDARLEIIIHMRADNRSSSCVSQRELEI